MNWLHRNIRMDSQTLGWATSTKIAVLNSLPHSNSSDANASVTWITGIQDADAQTFEGFFDTFLHVTIFALRVPFKMTSGKVFAQNGPG